MRQDAPLTVILGTGGTIAGAATDRHDNLGYAAATLDIADLVAAVPALTHVPLEAEQVARLDSKDMEPSAWLALAQRLAFHLQRPEVGSIVVTHGTDTLEETAWFLQRVLEPTRPVVLTAAMRPATSLQADGPQNLLDAVCVARASAAHGRAGVTAVLASRVWPAAGLRKLHPYRLDAFTAGDAGALAAVEEGHVRWWRESPTLAALPVAARATVLASDPAGWPWVAVVASHAGADGREVDALLAAGCMGLVVAGTGHASIHHRLERAIERTQAHGVPVWRTSRCTAGDLAGATDLPGSLTPWQARVELQLRLVAGLPTP
jgi:L-asparaginase